VRYGTANVWFSNCLSKGMIRKVVVIRSRRREERKESELDWWMTFIRLLRGLSMGVINTPKWITIFCSCGKVMTILFCFFFTISLIHPQPGIPVVHSSQRFIYSCFEINWITIDNWENDFFHSLKNNTLVQLGYINGSWVRIIIWTRDLNRYNAKVHVIMIKRVAEADPISGPFIIIE